MIKTIFYLTGALLLVLALGFAFQVPAVTSLWMWPDGKLSYIFVGSMLAAMSAAIIWIGYDGDLAASFPGAINWTVAFSLMAVSMIGFRGNPELPGLNIYIVIFFALAILSLIFGWWGSRNFTLQDTRPMPPLVKGSVVVFMLVLAVVSSLLLAQYPTVFPWPLKPHSSMMFGSLFLGSCVYFAYTLFRPSWGVAKSQLLAFLAYDLVLIVPYLRHLSTVKPEHKTSLIVYLTVIIYTMLLCIYYLFINKSTRITG